MRARSTEASVCPARTSTPPWRARKGKDVSGTSQIAWAGCRINRHLDGLRAVEGRDAGRNTIARIDRFGERGAEVRSILGAHRAEPELVQPLFRHRQADQATAILRHEVDRLRGDHFGGHGQVAFVFAVFIVNHDDHSTGANFFNSGRHVTELRFLSHRGYEKFYQTQRWPSAGFQILDFRLKKSSIRTGFRVSRSTRNARSLINRLQSL